MADAATPLVGRGQELAAIADRLPGYGTGRGGVVIVDGEPGVGKTALLDEAVREAERTRARVLTSVANELEMRMPFGAIRSWLPAYRPSDDDEGRMVERIRELLRGEGAEAGGAVAWEISVLDALVDLIENLCATGPVMLVMDDAHWADRSSLGAITRLQEVTDELPLLLVLALRPLPRTPTLSGLLDGLIATGTTQVPLGPLTDRDGADLAANMLGAPVGPALARALAWTAGNPLFIVELFTTAGRVLYAGFAHENLAAVHAESGQTTAARTALDTAIELYSGLQAEWVIARAEARLRRLGLRYGRRGPRKRPKTGWAALTPTELRVAEFVTQGRSNSQIATQMLLSRRTIQTHVSSILTKLDLDSRVQIALSHAQGA